MTPDEIRDSVYAAVRDALRGDAHLGQKGIIGRVDDLEDNDELHDQEHLRLNSRLESIERRWLVLVALMIGSGIGGGVVGSLISQALSNVP